MVERHIRPFRRFAKGLCAGSLLAMAALAGCTSVSHETTGSIARPVTNKPVSQMSPNELQGALTAYGSAYDQAPKDKGTGMAYAAVLQMAGRNDQSLAVMQQVAIANPTDREVLGAYGKALAAAGDLPKALETIRRAQTPDQPDWRLYSAEGAILDQIGQSDQARIVYGKALDIKPNDPNILSNLGMSYLLTNDLPNAEKALRAANAQPGVDSRVRQNLALVVGLQGRFEEAESIASAAMSPEEASANVAYLRQMIAQQNTWNMLKDKPSQKS